MLPAASSRFSPALPAVFSVIGFTLVACAVTPKNEPSISGAPSGSVAPNASQTSGAPAAASAAPMVGVTRAQAVPAGPEALLPRGPTLIAGPFRADDPTEASTATCQGQRAYALYGDPVTRVLDGVWLAVMRDCANGFLQTVERVPTAARVVDAFPFEGGVYAVLESVATRAQPGGLRTVIDLSDPRPTGIVAPADRAALLPLLPPASVFASAVFAKDRFGILPSPPLPGTPLPPVEQWLAPEGLVIEDVFQDHFASEITRRSPRDPRVSALARRLREDPHGCRNSRFDDEPRGVCWKGIERHGHVAIVRSPAGGTPVVRALGNTIYGKRLFGSPAPPLTLEQHRAVLQAFADRQPVKGTLIAAGPLGPWGGSMGVLLVSSPEPRAYVLRVDGPAMAIDIPDAFRELPAALREGGKTEALVLAEANAPSRLLLRVDRAPKRPWTTLVHTRHPLEDERRAPAGRDIVEDESSVFRLLRATSITEAESIVRAPPVHATAAELTELFDAIGDRAHLLAHAAKDAVFLEQNVGKNLGDGDARPLADVSGDVLRKLASLGKERWVKKPNPHGDEQKSFFERTGPTGPMVLVLDVWLTREAGKLRVGAVVAR